jgi:glycosyltransferase involved in cell wall biosynthesis
MVTVYQVNLWPGFGGSEVYTRFVAEALVRLGHESVLFTNASARFWRELKLPGVRLIPVARQEEIAAVIRRDNRPASMVLAHSGLSGQWADALRQDCLVAGFLHQPLQFLNQGPYKLYDWIVPVSEHCGRSATALSYENVYPLPLYGIADTERLRQAGRGPMVETSRYDWDPRKPRDRVLRFLFGMLDGIRPRATLARRPGITLGVVSRLATMKQFPELFALIAPAMGARREIWLDVFGSGGWSHVNRMKAALRPLGDRVRFWGHQPDVAGVYESVDYLLTGLPEREGLPLNVLEAQASGVPVIAPDAPPFNEAVLHGCSGFLYEDPRLDGGRGFADLLGKLCDLNPAGKAFDPRQRAAVHLRQFGMDAFCDRLQRLVAFLLARNVAGTRMDDRPLLAKRDGS